MREEVSCVFSERRAGREQSDGYDRERGKVGGEVGCGCYLSTS